MPLTVDTAQKAARAPASPLAGFGKLLQPKAGAQERIFFTEQLALLLETGTSMHVALNTMEQHVSNPMMASILRDLARQVSEGRSLSQALSTHPALFSTTYVNLVAASEEGGFLLPVLGRLLEHDEKRQQLRRTLISAASYPVFLILFSLAVVVFVLVAVFPKFEAMFSAIKDQLPWTTQVLMLLSDLVRHHWPWLAIAAGLLGAGAWYLAATPRGRMHLDRLKLSLPLISRVYIQIYMVESLRVLGMSLANGVSVRDALVSARDVVKNQLFQNFICQLEEQVKEGKGLAMGFRQSPLIPVLVQQMVATGEETGNLPKVLERLAGFYERELSKQLEMLSRLAEPLMLVVMGAVVGLLVSSLILPIFKLSQVVH
ncbi:type II secretion system F family protein [Pseudomonas benzenivorans]|uniref:Type II secretion system F family protein n=1 Tax=Pseudomonas benzenivorans TaxID=556533 RepID=A0ABY5H676_9PSED|nr:type II secretion system F family protein [Pseudomonas benzenivorans]UTW07128.1 type II secretion system F family protein [Pseudomonas benzenivorans]